MTKTVKRVLIVAADAQKGVRIAETVTASGINVLGVAPTPFCGRFYCLGQGMNAAIIQFDRSEQTCEFVRELERAGIPVILVVDQGNIVPPLPPSSFVLFEEPFELTDLAKALHALPWTRTGGADGLSNDPASQSSARNLNPNASLRKRLLSVLGRTMRASPAPQRLAMDRDSHR